MPELSTPSTAPREYFPIPCVPALHTVSRWQTRPSSDLSAPECATHHTKPIARPSGFENASNADLHLVQFLALQKLEDNRHFLAATVTVSQLAIFT